MNTVIYYILTFFGGVRKIFEGKDYSNKSQRDAELNPFSGAGFQFLDPGKRERKMVVNYSETLARLQVTTTTIIIIIIIIIIITTLLSASPIFTYSFIDFRLF